MLDTDHSDTQLASRSTIRNQLGDQWQNLHPNIQERFKQDPVLGEQILYRGTMQIIARSRMGWLFAQLTRIIGNPLTPYAGEDVPMDVLLYKQPGKDGVFWRRTYFYPGRPSFSVISVKRESPQGEMMECVGGGFGMLLRVYVQDTQLHFKSYRYFWEFAGLRVPLPHWLTPGTTHVMHEDLGGGNFKFTVAMTHTHLGQTFYQEGIFSRR